MVYLRAGDAGRHGANPVCKMHTPPPGVLGHKRVPGAIIRGQGSSKKAAHLDAAERAITHLVQHDLLSAPKLGGHVGGPPPSSDSLLALLREEPQADSVRVPAQAHAHTLDHELTLDDVDDIDDMAVLREHLKRALQENQVFQAQVAGLNARIRRAMGMLSDGDVL